MLALRDLIPLREIGIKIIFAVKLRKLGNLAPEREADRNHLFHRLLIDRRQGSRVPHTNWTDIDIGVLLVRIIQGITKHLGLGFELNVDFQTNDGFILHTP